MGYFTIKGEAKGYFESKKSKFYSFAFPILNEEEAKAIIQKMKAQYSDANHVCYAYGIGKERNIWKAIDSGEPSNSAGMPIFGQIRSANLSDIIILVVRYFGGTKLGVGGLQEAYKEAAKSALEQAEMIEFIQKEEFLVQIPFKNVDKVLHLLRVHHLGDYEQEFSQYCSLKVRVPLEKMEVFKNQIKKYEL